MRKAVIIAAMVAILGGAGYGGWRYFKKDTAEGQFKTAAVERGDVVQTVKASGDVQPIRLVQVGTQVNGPIRKLYVDYNSKVQAGELVAQIDPTVYEARLAQDQANLASAEAAVDSAQAKVVQAERDLERARKLAERQMLSPSDLDAAVAARDVLAAQLKVSRASVEQAKAALRLSQANLGYTTIRSPVNGVVVARNVDEGQTVVASMSAQVLFQIATDLTQVQIEADVPEADIGKVREGQPVTFTVDAYDETFTGKVSQIRLSSAKVQNVVTYPVIILANNPEVKLFPGMTANIVCEVDRRVGALKVSNAALRFKPAGSSADKGEGKRNGSERHSGARGPKLWVQNGKALQPVPVTLGITDGSFTELIEPSKATEGQEVVVAALTPEAEEAKVVNPFSPQIPRGNRRLR